MYVYFNETKLFLRLLERVDRKWYPDVIQLLQRQHKESSSHQTVPSPFILEVLQTHSTPPCISTTVSQKGKYGKLEIWIEMIYDMCIFLY